MQCFIPYLSFICSFGLNSIEQFFYSLNDFDKLLIVTIPTLQFKSNINFSQRCFVTYSEGPGGTCFIFPIKAYKKIYSVKAFGKNCLVITYRDYNDANIAMCNYYGKSCGSSALTVTRLEEIAVNLIKLKN